MGFVPLCCHEGICMWIFWPFSWVTYCLLLGCVDYAHQVLDKMSKWQFCHVITAGVHDFVVEYVEGFFFFWLLNDNIIQLAKELAISHTSISNFYRETTLIETERPKLDCILCSLMCSSIETSNPIKLQFKKKLRSSSILLTVVAMDQSDWFSAMVRGSKQDFASPSMMICSQFSVRASWIEQSTAAASARSGEHNLCMLAQSVSPSFALHN